jgi:selenocysteine lyase/cysteine desulfurase
MYASDRALARGDHPLFVDMRGASWVDADRYEPVESARRFEDWEFPYALVLGLGEAARYARTVGLDLAQQRAFALAAYARERLEEIPGARVLDRGRVRCAIVTVAMAGRPATDLAAALRARRINTSASLRSYGILDFDAKGVESALRISPHYYNTVAEIDLLIEALNEIARGGA